MEFLELLVPAASSLSEVPAVPESGAEERQPSNVGHWSGQSSHTAKSHVLERPISGSERVHVRLQLQLRRTLLPCLEQGRRQKELLEVLDPRAEADLESRESVRP